MISVEERRFPAWTSWIAPGASNERPSLVGQGGVPPLA